MEWDDWRIVQSALAAIGVERPHDRCGLRCIEPNGLLPWRPGAPGPANAWIAHA
jgi:hypothetical protein